MNGAERDKVTDYFPRKLQKTGPCEQGNWDTWMEMDPWDQVW